MASMTRIAAVILAGGKAERLGGINKALLEIGGRRLIDRALEATAGCAPVLLAIGHSPFEIADLTQVPDLDADYAGPLAGVAAAVDALGGDDAGLLFTLAVDTPFFPHDFVARALPLLEAAPGALAAFGAQDYPTNALWRLDALRDLPDAVRAGTASHSLKRLAQNLGAARLDYAEIAAEDPFANVNTPADLALLTARASV
jgi:molybdopterin-guanine dinucleotide biosynthesis protein A